MKFNTITYDANLPTVQQVNVPTNSDYKVGMKVKRNGAVQSIKPSEFTVYTGETTPVEPETTTLNLSNQTDYYSGDDIGLFSAFSAGGSEISALVGIELYANKMEFPSANVEYGGNTYELDTQYLYLMIDDGLYKLSNGKWLDTDGNTYDTITIPSATPILVGIPADDIVAALGHIIPDNTNIKGTVDIIYTVKEGGDVPVTYPVDPDKTNGYVTITRASGDNASFKQYGVHIDKGYDFDDYIKLEGLATTNDKIQFPADTTAESLGIGGLRMYADKTRLGYNTAGTEPLTPDDCTYWIEPATVAMASFIVFNWPNGQAAVWMAAAAKNKLCYMPLGSSDVQVVDYVDIDPSWILRIGSTGLRPTLNKYYIVAYDLQLGTPFSADFKLNINEFKSQSGDIAETLADGTSVKVDGTYADGTTFSFDFCTK